MVSSVRSAGTGTSGKREGGLGGYGESISRHTDCNDSRSGGIGIQSLYLFPAILYATPGWVRAARTRPSGMVFQRLHIETTAPDRRSELNSLGHERFHTPPGLCVKGSSRYSVWPTRELAVIFDRRSADTEGYQKLSPHRRKYYRLLLPWDLGYSQKRWRALHPQDVRFSLG
jgi:hypothetical protein